MAEHAGDLISKADIKHEHACDNGQSHSGRPPCTFQHNQDGQEAEYDIRIGSAHAAALSDVLYFKKRIYTYRNADEEQSNIVQMELFDAFSALLCQRIA